MSKIHIWTDERTGRTFRIIKLPVSDRTYQWTVERDTLTHEPLGFVFRQEREIWAVTSTVPDVKADRIPVDSIEDGWKVVTEGA